MAFWMCLFLGVFAGITRFGRQARRQARDHRVDEATAALRKGALFSALFAMLMTVVFFGWPFHYETISVPEEVTRTIIETVEVPVVVTSWIFFSTTKLELQEVPRQVTETIVSTRRGTRFSPFLLLPMAIVGLCAHALHLRTMHWLWRVRG